MTLSTFNQEFDSQMLDLVKQKSFYPHEWMYDFEKFKKKMLGKNKFYSLLSCQGISDKVHQHVLKVWNKSEMKIINGNHDLCLKCNVLLSADEHFRNMPRKLWFMS